VGKPILPKCNLWEKGEFREIFQEGGFSPQKGLSWGKAENWGEIKGPAEFLFG